MYHRPVGTDAVTDTTIESTKYNVYVADVEQDLNLPRPLVAGGTGASGADGALDNLSAEKFKQVVTNWDAMTWRAGSFYAATTATGAAPVAGHAFAGLAYYANTSDFVLEAIDTTDTDSPVKYVRTQSAGVWGPWTAGGGGAIPAGSALVGDYYFNATTAFPPGSGQVRFNNVAQTVLTTELLFSHLTATNIDVTTALPLNIFNGSEITIRDKDEPTKYKIFTATAAPVLSGGDFRVTVTFKSGGTDLTAQRVLVSTTGPAVRYDIAQTLTAAQKSQARANIDVLKKNYILNGGMQISQENGTTAGATAGYYAADQFGMTFSATTGVLSVAQSNVATPGGSTNRIRATVTTADVTVGASDVVALFTRLEGLRISDLKIGAGSAAKTVTIQFGVRAPAGTYCINLRNAPTYNRTYAAEYTIAAGEANIDVVKSVVVQLDTTGTWPTDNVSSLEVSWVLMAGSSSQVTSPATWQAGTQQATINQSNFMVFNTNVFDLFDVGLYEGTAAPAFQVPDYASELALCMRYYEKQTGRPLAYTGNVLSGSVYASASTFSAVKRAVPTVTATIAAQSSFSVGAPGYNVSISGVEIEASCNATASFGYYMMSYVANARL